MLVIWKTLILLRRLISTWIYFRRSKFCYIPHGLISTDGEILIILIGVNFTVVRYLMLGIISAFYCVQYNSIDDDALHNTVNTSWFAPWGALWQLRHYLGVATFSLSIYPFTPSSSHLRLHWGVVVVLDCPRSLPIALFRHRLPFDPCSFVMLNFPLPIRRI